MKENIVTFTNQRVFQLNETPYWLDFLNYRFYFSSDYNRQNFKKRFKPRKEKILNRLIAYVPSRNSENIKGIDKLTAINTYNEIEKKGFRVKDLLKGVEYLCSEEITVVVSLNK